MPFYVRSLLCLFIFWGSVAYSAERGNEQPRELPEELLQVFQIAGPDHSSRARELQEALHDLWQGAFLNAWRRDSVLHTLKLLQAARAKPWPDQGNYLSMVVAAASQAEASRLFTQWHQALLWTLQSQTLGRTSSFLERSVSFFNEQLLFRSGVVAWKYRGDSYEFVFSDNQPRLVLNNVTLTGYAFGDSTVLYNTSGEASLLNTIWNATGGRLTWHRAEMPQVYAQLQQYRLDLNMPSFQADSVMLYYPDFFDNPIPGKLSERILADVQEAGDQFPRFDSYLGQNELNELFPGISYRGGFSLEGARILGLGTADAPARLSILRNDSLFICVTSASFIIRNDRIISERAGVSIYLGVDSIFHPGLNFRYLNPQKEISMVRDERAGARAPFFNSYHKIFMYPEGIFWNLGEEKMQMRKVASLQNAAEALFESDQFFSPERYRTLQGMDDIHPLSRLSMFSRQVNTRSFPIADYARYLRREISVVKNELINLSFLGFLTYDRERERVTLADKLFHFISSNAGHSDYDIVRILSHAPVNAELNISTRQLEIFGVDQIALSNAKNVKLFPADSKLIMQANRNMLFNGQIESGLFKFYGNDFFFDYDSFRINLLNTDSMSFSVRSFEPDERGMYEYIKVKTVLQNINGELLVDDPRNKSGRMPFPRYPVFNSNNESYVYFDRVSTRDGVYSREDFYFKIIPFTLDSLDNVSTENLAFDGIFYSGGIFPEIHDYLRVQSDFYLGFNAHTPGGGFPVYGGKAWYTGPVNMNQQGLTTNGHLQFLEANVQAQSMIMYPDSISGLAASFSLSESTSPRVFPAVDATMAGILYLKDKNQMIVSSRNDPLVLFDQQAGFRGQLFVDAEGLTGKGEIGLFDATILADEFQFGTNDFVTGESFLGLQSRTSNENALTHIGYRSRFDLQTHTAYFEPLSAQAAIAFPSNHLSGSNFSYTWDIVRGQMHFVSSGKDRFPPVDALETRQWLEIDFSGYELSFTNPEKGALKFFASGLDFDVSQNQLHAHGVNLIRVADAAVFPHKQQLVVLEKGIIEPLFEATILASTQNRFHEFFDAEVYILSRNLYRASGRYHYLDERRLPQVLTFDQINVGAGNVTTARAKVSREQEFFISPHFAFMGDVELSANSQLLTFNGFSRIFMDCPMPEPQWFGFQAPVDPDRIFIPLGESLRDPQRDFLTLGIMMAADSIHIYPGIFAKRSHWADVAVVSANGYITYDHVSGDYRISSLEKLEDPGRWEDYLRISTDECVVQGQGRVDLGSDLGQFRLEPHGTVTMDIHSGEVDYNLLVGLNFFFPGDALSFIHSSIEGSQALELLSPNHDNLRRYQQLEAQLIRQAPAGSLRRQAPITEHTLLFGELKLRWDQSLRSLISVGDLGVVHVNRNLNFRYITGFVELRKQRGGDVFTMLLFPGGKKGEPLAGDWFYFTYSRGVMQTIASLHEYNQGIRRLPQRRRQMPVERGKEPYVFILSTDRRPFDFYEHMLRLSQY